MPHLNPRLVIGIMILVVTLILFVTIPCCTDSNCMLDSNGKYNNDSECRTGCTTWNCNEKTCVSVEYGDAPGTYVSQDQCNFNCGNSCYSTHGSTGDDDTVNNLATECLTKGTQGDCTQPDGPKGLSYNGCIDSVNGPCCSADSSFRTYENCGKYCTWGKQ